MSNGYDTPESGNGPEAQEDGTPPPPPPTAVNPQMLDAVNQTATAVFNQTTPAANGIAYQKVAQAASLAVQDATDYLRNMMTVFGTAQGKAAQLFLETKDPVYLTLLTQAEAAVAAATTNFQTVGTVATSVATTFPSK